MLCQGDHWVTKAGGRVNTPALSDPKEILASLIVVQHFL